MTSPFSFLFLSHPTTRRDCFYTVLSATQVGSWQSGWWTLLPLSFAATVVTGLSGALLVVYWWTTGGSGSGNWWFSAGGW